MRAEFRVQLDGAVSGLAIADAVKAIAGSYYKALELVNDEGEFYRIGQSSNFGQKNLLVGVGDRNITEINMDTLYGRVIVLSWDGPREGITYGPGEPEQVVEAVRSFRDKLQTILNGVANLP